MVASSADTVAAMTSTDQQALRAQTKLRAAQQRSAHNERIEKKLEIRATKAKEAGKFSRASVELHTLFL